MIPYILRKIIKFLESNKILLIQKDAQTLLANAKSDLESFQFINYYHVNAKKQFSDALLMLNEYTSNLLQFKNKNSELPKLVSLDLEEIFTLLNRRKTTLETLRNKIPNGILDVKRALSLSGNKFSTIDEENEELINILILLKDYLTNLNKSFMKLVKKGDPLEDVLWNTSIFYWKELQTYRGFLIDVNNYFIKCKAHLTTEGVLAARSIKEALNSMPSKTLIDSTLSIMNRDKKNKIALLHKHGFCSDVAIDCCLRLKKLKKTYFYLPHDNDKYHFDYNPKQDLAETGGDCFGQSISVILSLIKGQFKWLCPELDLLNYQLEQARTLPPSLSRKIIANAETEVSSASQYHSIQWNDLARVFNDEQLKKDDICGLMFTQNSYTKSQRSFTAGHIAMVAKLDIEKNPYKYIVFEKELGLFGLTDDNSLEIIINAIMALYQNMNYSIAQLVKYGEATDQTYKLLNSIRPFSLSVPVVSPVNVGIFKTRVTEPTKLSVPSMPAP